jgi:hypothetical protein
MMRSEVLENRNNSGVEGWRWLAYFFIGAITGAIAFLMSTLEEFLIDKRDELTEKTIQAHGN